MNQSPRNFYDCFQYLSNFLRCSSWSLARVGYVSTEEIQQLHNILANVSPENVVAMMEAINSAR